MSDTKHTTGPWRLSQIGFAHNDGSIPVLEDSQAEDSKIICTVNLQAKAKRGEAWKTPCAERDANAKLISAAPDLLAACEALVATCTNAPPIDLMNRIGDCNAQARAAIAKATGEA